MNGLLLLLEAGVELGASDWGQLGNFAFQVVTVPVGFVVVSLEVSASLVISNTVLLSVDFSQSKISVKKLRPLFFGDVLGLSYS